MPSWPTNKSAAIKKRVHREQVQTLHSRLPLVTRAYTKNTHTKTSSGPTKKSAAILVYGIKTLCALLAPLRDVGVYKIAVQKTSVGEQNIGPP